jgi:hypothetical protein
MRLTASEIFEDVNKNLDFEARAERLATYIKVDPEFAKLIHLAYVSDLSFSNATTDAVFGPKTNVRHDMVHITFREFLKEANILHDGIPNAPARPTRKRDRLEFIISEMHYTDAAICLNAITHVNLTAEINSDVAKRAYEMLGLDTSGFHQSHHSEQE